MAEITGTPGNDTLTGTDRADRMFGYVGNDTLDGGGGHDELSGGEGDDTLFGGDGNDIVSGDEGADTLYGGAGNDVLWSDGDDDLIDGGSGTDHAILNFGSYTADLEFTHLATATLTIGSVTLKSVENFTLTGGHGSDRFTGGAGTYTFFGRDGSDTLKVGAGNDKLVGGNGSDSLHGGSGDDVLYGGNDDIYYYEDNAAQAGSDKLYGEGGNDAIYVAGVDSLVDGGDGDDTLYIIHGVGGRFYGGWGNDVVRDYRHTALAEETGSYPWENPFLQRAKPQSYTVDLGSGNDRFEAILHPEDEIVLDGGTGTDHVSLDFRYYTTGLKFTVSGAATFTIASVTLTNVEILELVGGKGKDSFSGGAGKDIFDGSSGNDILYGSGGNDSLNGGSGGDLLDGGTGHDFLGGGKGSDKLYGQSGKDDLSGGDGNDKLYGGSGNDRFWGDAGSDLLDGGTGADLLTGNAGNDTYIVDNKGDKVIELARQGTDHVVSSISYRLTPNVENLTLVGSDKTSGTGNNLSNTITGNNTANTLSGGSNNDKLIGGLGADRLYGGTGSDIFIFETLQDSTPGKSGRDRIFYFSKGDRIDISAIDASTKKVGDQGFTFIGTNDFSRKAGELRYDKGTSNTYIRGDVDGDGKADFAIHLDDAQTLVKADFIL